MMTSNVFPSTAVRREQAREPGSIAWADFLNRPILSPPRSPAALRDRTILVTGAGGTIGSALCRALLREPAGGLLFLDNSARRLDALYRDSKDIGCTSRIEFVQCDIRDTAGVQQAFSTFRPDVVFHAAAMKHLVPLESAPFQALENNVLGTSHLIQAAIEWKTRLFVNVSTDKAVSPTSMLGISKRITEGLLAALDDNNITWISARLGNVLGSSGSVVPHFLNAIRNRRPVTITHPDASRYFMTLDEVVAVLFHCMEIAQSTLLLPDMGPDHRIVDLADFLMKHSGARTGVRYAGLRDGEKLREQLVYDHEQLENTGIPRVFRILNTSGSSTPNILDALARLRALVHNRRRERLIETLTEVEPEFTPSLTLQRYVTTGSVT